MKKTRFAALILAAALTAVSAGCRANSTKVEENVNGGAYAGISGVADDSVTVSIGEEANKNNTTYTLNSVIDSGYVQDGLKYIYLDVTIKNTSDTDYEANAINNFYLILDDSTEVLPGVLADNYAKQHINGYEHLSGIAANSEFNGYIGFALDESIDSFTVGFFPTATDIDDKSNVVYTKISSDDIKSAPEGFIQ
jgi:hypothetical protein